MSEKITAKEVRHVARLARLDLTDQEERTMTQQLNAILDYMGKLNQVDTSNVPPTTHAIEFHNVFREDKICPSLERSRALENAPESDGTAFVVPKII